MTEPLAFVVLGSPVGHSRSPMMHNAGLRALGLSGRYEAVDTDLTGLREHADLIRSGVLRGANITMPHKRSAARLSDVLTERARRSDSVNTWLLADGQLLGDSTDVPGIVDVMTRHEMTSESVLILGTGGAAAAAVIACESRDVWVSGRSSEKAKSLVDRLDVDARICEWGDGVDGATVLNATPVGMHGESLDSSVLANSAAVFDMTYGPQVSPAIAHAIAARVPYADGIHLLAAQAERSFELWTGRTPPVGLFEQVARNVSRPPDRAPI